MDSTVSKLKRSVCVCVWGGGRGQVEFKVSEGVW